MRAQEFIQESVTFSPSRLIDNTFSGEEWWEKVDEECPACEGTGKEESGDDPKSECWYCNGTGKVKRTISNAPELDVSNANAHVVLKILGIDKYDDDELIGRIPSSEFPALQQRLLKLRNIAGKRQQFEIPSTTTKSVGGPTMYDFGVSGEQVTHYIDQLMDIIKFAQKTDADNVYLTWA